MFRGTLAMSIEMISSSAGSQIDYATVSTSVLLSRSSGVQILDA